MSHTADSGRGSNRDSIIDSGVAARVVAATADFAVIVDRDDVVREVLVADDFDAQPGWRNLVGKRWSDTVTRESQPKVARLLSDPRDGRPVRSRELNQKVEGLGEVPFRFTAVLLDDAEHVVALGRDLRPVSAVQQQIVSAQHAMDREYGRMRQAQARYRVFFDVASEGVVIADLASLHLLEVNAAAAAMLGEAPQALQGRGLLDLFEPPSRAAVQALVAGVEVKARTSDVVASLIGNHGREVNVSASVFRQSGAAVLLLRFSSSATAVQSARVRSERMLAIVDAMPDGFVVTGQDRRILFANDAFCRLVQRDGESHVIGESIDRWLGRPGVDIDTMFANLGEHGTIRNFPTLLRGDATTQEMFVTAAAALDGRVPCIGFAIRTASSRAAGEPIAAGVPRSVDQMRELVGRVSLKEIVRESADLIERLCIQAALEVSGNNRASAAQLLGLSRQGLYSKLQRHALAEFGPA